MKERQLPKIFADTSLIAEIQKLMDLRIISGITTNPILVAEQSAGSDPRKYYEELTRKFPCVPISIQLLDEDVPTLIEQAEGYAAISPNVVVKVPMFGDGRGLTVLSELSGRGIKTNVTALMQKEQLLLALLAGKRSGNGPTYVSLFFNRIRDGAADREFDPQKDGSGDPGEEIRQSRLLIDQLGIDTEIITGSIRKGADVFEAVAAGTNIVTVQPKVIHQMIGHRESDRFIRESQERWETAMSGSQSEQD